MLPPRQPSDRGLRNVGFHRWFAADVPFVRRRRSAVTAVPYSAGIWFIASPLWLSAISACAGGRPESRSPDYVSNGGAQVSVAPDSSELATLLAPLFAEGMAREQIPGAVFVLVADGRVVLARGYGVADVPSGRPADPATTIFPIASISKLFTATALMQLADRKRLDLHTDVNRYLTSARVPPTYLEPITAAQLLAHTAGLDELPGATSPFQGGAGFPRPILVEPPRTGSPARCHDQLLEFWDGTCRSAG